MANNPYVNKVVKADGTTIIDISDTTAAAADVAAGKYFYTAAGAKVEGTNSGSSLPDGDNLSYGSAPLAGYAVVGCGLCTPLPHVGEAVVGDIL